MRRDRLDAVHDRHLDVHHDQVGREGVRLLDAVEAVLGLADDRHVRLLADQGRDRPPEQRLVINQQDADGRRRVHGSPRS